MEPGLTTTKPGRRQVLGAALAAAPSLRLARGSARRPNIVFVFTDDQRHDTVAALGNPIVQTPHMDALVREGTAITGASIMGSTISAVCTPSRAMVLTGQNLFHAHDNLMRGPKPDFQRPPRPYHLFPELLGQNGYRTFCSGKWGNGGRILNRCFQEARNIFFRWAREGTDQSRFPVAQYDPQGAYPYAAQQIVERFTSEVFTDAAVDFIGNYRGNDPFFVYTAYLSPHDPRTPPKRFADLYDPKRIPLPPNFDAEHRFYNGHMRNRDEMLAPFPRTPERIREEIALYYGMISEVDFQIGRILSVLEKTGRARDTIVVFAGDNGLAVGQHGLVGKQSLYEHSIRVPLVLRGPGIPSNRRIGAPAYLHDLFPTLFDLAGLPVPPTVESRSLAPLLSNPDAPLRDATFHAFRHLHRAVRKDGWKLIRYHVNGVHTTQLFDLRNDPWERYNRAGDPAHEGRLRELDALLRSRSRAAEDYVNLDLPDWGGAILGEGQ